MMEKLVPQFGMEMEDAFAVVLILETIFVAVTEAVFMEGVYMMSTSSDGHEHPWWIWPLLLAITVKAILFIGLVWVGFISLGRSSMLRLWLVLGVVLDTGFSAILVIWHMANASGHIPLWAVSLVLIYWVLFLSLRFYIYMVAWKAWKVTSEGHGLKGYASGIRYLFLNYKNEFARITLILLTVEIVWNSWTALTIDMPLEISYGISVGGSFLYRPMIGFRFVRIVLASLVLYFVKSKKSRCLKYSCAPFLLLSIGLAIFAPVFVYLAAETPQTYALMVPAYFTEILMSLVVNMILFYSIIGLVIIKPCTPVPFVHAPE